MAYRLKQAGDGRVDYGDIPLGGAVELTIAIRLRPLIAPNSERIISQWGNLASEQAFLMQAVDANEVGLVFSNGVSTLSGKKTSTLKMGAGRSYGIVATTVFGSPPVIRIWVNGVAMALSAFGGSGNITVMIDSVKTIQVGHETDEAADGVEGDYEDFAIWGRVLPPWVAANLSAGVITPAEARAYNPLLYAPLDSRGTLDVWQGRVGTPTSASPAPTLRRQPARRVYVDIGAAAAGQPTIKRWQGVPGMRIGGTTFGQGWAS